ncbi:MAG TPA: hypothetical protein VMY78_04905 [Solirubrobacteraceae bacterium]|nr:hypothetical protein [Solirubrobacteraceae bacterium]
MRARVDGRGSRRRLLWLPAVIAAAVALVAGVAAAAPSKPVVIQDAAEDVTGPLDLQRVSLSRASDGRLRAVLTFAAEVTPANLLADTGPPGSACLRIWTAADADPAAMRPDRLVCVTAGKDEKLRAGVFEQRDAGLPRRLANASVKPNASGRSFVVRVSQSSLGRPALIRFAAESTRAGCDRTSCVDSAPDGGAVRRFRLR